MGSGITKTACSTDWPSVSFEQASKATGEIGPCLAFQPPSCRCPPAPNRSLRCYSSVPAKWICGWLSEREACLATPLPGQALSPQPHQTSGIMLTLPLSPLPTLHTQGHP